MSLTFKALREANLARLPLFKNKQGGPAHNTADGSDWKLTQWVNAIAGELGEFSEQILTLMMARAIGNLANTTKKMERGDYPNTLEANEYLASCLENELADVLIYADLVAFRLGFDLDAAVVSKFNEVSRRVGCDVFIQTKTPYGWWLPADNVIDGTGTMYLQTHSPCEGAIPLYR